MVVFEALTISLLPVVLGCSGAFKAVRLFASFDCSPQDRGLEVMMRAASGIALSPRCIATTHALVAAGFTMGVRCMPVVTLRHLSMDKAPVVSHCAPLFNLDTLTIINRDVLGLRTSSVPCTQHLT